MADGPNTGGSLARIQALGDDAMLDAAEAGALLGCSESAFRRLRLPSVRLGPKLLRWRYGALRHHLRLLENRSQHSA